MLKENHQKIKLAHKVALGLLAASLLALGSLWVLGQNEQNAANANLFIDDASLSVEFADEPDEMSRGLSGKENLNVDEGMLFIFEEARIPAFWMKDMHFPIDIIWIDDNKRIVGIEHSIHPDTHPKTFSPDKPIKYALEVNAGWAESNEISLGEAIKFSK